MSWVYPSMHCRAEHSCGVLGRCVVDFIQESVPTERVYSLSVLIGCSCRCNLRCASGGLYVHHRNLTQEELELQNLSSDTVMALNLLLFCWSSVLLGWNSVKHLTVPSVVKECRWALS